MTDGNGHDPDSTIRVVLRPIGSPLPLGFFAFGIGSAMLSFQQYSVIPPTDARLLSLLLVVFVFPLQLLAAVLAFLSREPIAATLLGLLAFSWPSNAVVTVLGNQAMPSGPLVGLFYLCLSVVILLLSVPALGSKPVLGAVGVLAVTRYVLYGTSSLTGSQVLAHWSGGVGFAIFVVALYGGVALAVEDVAHRTVLPFPRIGGARDALESGVFGQVRDVAREAGVRQQL